MIRILQTIARVFSWLLSHPIWGGVGVLVGIAALFIGANTLDNGGPQKSSIPTDIGERIDLYAFDSTHTTNSGKQYVMKYNIQTENKKQPCTISVTRHVTVLPDENIFETKYYVDLSQIEVEFEELPRDANGMRQFRINMNRSSNSSPRAIASRDGENIATGVFIESHDDSSVHKLFEEVYNAAAACRLYSS